VITFSEAQMVAVQMELDVRRRARPELEAFLNEDGPEGFFVKNLENVQGDERDVIFFSVGYGPDSSGKITMNFGPLNRLGGERRLNVAVTRARDQIKILASFHPTEIDRGRTNARGVRLLRSYLEFAQQGPIALLGDITAAGGEPESPFEEAVARALEAEGLSVVSQVGVGAFRIDLAIRDGDADVYLLGIECDGATYHSSKTARDRDRLRQEVLETLGWRIHRIWSTDWLKDPQGEVARVVAALEEARAASSARRHPPAEVVSRNGSRLEADTTHQAQASHENGRPIEEAPNSSLTPLDGRRADAPRSLISASSLRPIPYRPVKLVRQGIPERLEQDSRRRLPDLVTQCVTEEGPVHVDRVLRAIALSYGIHRVGPNVRATIMNAVEVAAAKKLVRIEGAFLWPAAMTSPPVRGYLPSGKVRPVGQIAPEELARAVTMVLTQSFAMSHADLIVAAARLLGYERAGSLVHTAIDTVIAAMLRSAVLHSAGDQVRLGERSQGVEE